MSTLLTVVNSLRTELSSQLSLATQFGADYATELETMSSSVVAQAQTMYRIRHQYQQNAEGSNTAWASGAIEVEIAHRLSDPFDERAYTEAAMQTQQSTLLARAFWRALTGLHAIEGGPDLELDVVREGNVFRWSVLCTFLITP